MKTQELISIIIPLHNVEKYLNKCIQSVVNQTYENLEIILIDDGSTDRCPQICDEWAEKDLRIRTIHKTYGGVADARNVGLSAANGEYIGFVDSDDYVENTMFEHLYKVLKETNADISICDFQKITENGEIIPIESDIKREVITGTDALEKITKSGDWYYIILWNKLYKKEILKEINFPKGKIYEDEFAAHQIFFRCNRIACIDKKLYYYVRRNGSIMTGTIGVKCLDKVEAFCNRVCFYEEHGLETYKKNLSARLKSIYHCQRIAITTVDNYTEKKRVAEIDKLFKETYFNYAQKVTVQEKIMYTIPGVWFLCYKLKKKLFNK